MCTEVDYRTTLRHGRIKNCNETIVDSNLCEGRGKTLLAFQFGEISGNQDYSKTDKMVSVL